MVTFNDKKSFRLYPVNKNALNQPPTVLSRELREKVNLLGPGVKHSYELVLIIADGEQSRKVPAGLFDHALTVDQIFRE